MASRRPSLRKGHNKEVDNRPKRNGWRGNYRDRLKEPKAQATPILLCAGKYVDYRDECGDDLPYHIHLSHSYRPNKNTFRSSACGCGYGSKESDDCLCCKQIEEGDNRVGPGRDKFSFNCLHLALYEQVEARDKDGKIKTYSEDKGDHKRGDARMNWEEVTKPRDKRDILDDIDALLQEGSVRLLSKKYIEVGKGHRDAIMGIDMLSSKFCLCGGDIEATSFQCSSCSGELCDIMEENMDAADADAYYSSRQRCKSCSHTDFPIREVICSECGEDAEPLTAFDVVAWVRKQGEGTSTQYLIEKIVPVWDFKLADGSYLVKDTDENGYPIYDEDTTKLVENQFDFDMVHKPKESRYIAQDLGCDDPFSRGGRGKYSNAPTTRVDSGDGEEAPRRGRGRGRSRQRR